VKEFDTSLDGSDVSALSRVSFAFLAYCTAGSASTPLGFLPSSVFGVVGVAGSVLALSGVVVAGGGVVVVVPVLGS